MIALGSLLSACAGDPASPADRPAPVGQTGETGVPATGSLAETGRESDPLAHSGGSTAACGAPLEAWVDGAPLPAGGTLDLGSTPARAGHLRATLTLRNPCEAEEVRLLGHPDDWVEGEGFALEELPPIALEPGASAELGLVFTPGAPGQARGRFSLPHDHPDSPLTLELSATVGEPLPLVFAGAGRRVALTLDYGDSWAADGWESLEGHDETLQRGACAGPQGWLTVGGSARRSRWRSDDGQAWTATDDGVGWIADCAWGDGRYVMVGSAGLLAVSEDAASFRAGGTGAGVHLRAVAYGDGSFVAVGADRRAVTEDGTTWSVDLTSPHGTADRVAFGGGVFVAVGAGGLIETSADRGRTWTARHLGTSTWAGVVWAGDRFLAGNGSELYQSPDGQRWSLVNASFVTPIAAVGTLVFGTFGESLHRSEDQGFTWTEILPSIGGPAFADAAPGVAP